jgi:hypothetical protein
MACVSDIEFERLKKGVALERLVLVFRADLLGRRPSVS